MAESRTHRDLVAQLRYWIAMEFCDNDLGSVFVDDGDPETGPTPPRIDGYQPDVYCQVTGTDRVVVGEAKTETDLETERSMHQLLAFLKFCELRRNSCFVIAVPWYAERTATNTLGNLKSRHGLSNACVVVMPQLHAAALVLRSTGG